MHLVVVVVGNFVIRRYSAVQMDSGLEVEDGSGNSSELQYSSMGGATLTANGCSASLLMKPPLMEISGGTLACNDQ